MEMLADFRKVAHRLKETFARVLRVAGKEPYPLDAVDLIYPLQQLHKRGRPIGGHPILIFIGIHILSEQSHFLITVISQRTYLFDNTLCRPADFPASDIRNDTVRAKIITTLHNRDKSGNPFCLIGDIPYFRTARGHSSRSAFKEYRLSCERDFRSCHYY